jgi:hypothetical protein
MPLSRSKDQNTTVLSLFRSPLSARLYGMPLESHVYSLCVMKTVFRWRDGEAGKPSGSLDRVVGLEPQLQCSACNVAGAGGSGGADVNGEQ